MKSYLLIFSFFVSSAAFAFDWNQYAKTPEVDTTLRVSTLTFENISYAHGFCRNLKMKIADPHYLAKMRNEGKLSDPLLSKALRFKVSGEQSDLTGLMGWMPPELAPESKFDIFIFLDSDQTEVSADQLSAINQKLVENGRTPFKKMPVVCMPK